MTKNQENDDHLKLGQRGEKRAAEYLRDRGFRILERNWRYQIKRNWWEIDIIAEDRSRWWPLLRKRRLVFVEVKTVKKTGHFIGEFSGHPELQVDMHRQQRLIRAAQFYLRKHGISEHSNWQIDVVGIIWDAETDTLEIRHTERAVGDMRR